MKYKIYLDKEESFSCEAVISNASNKNATARLVLEAGGLSLLFNGSVNKNEITIPIKGNLQKLFTEEDTGKLKLEVIVENMLVTPWESEVEFEKYNKVVIKEVKNVVVSTPIVEVKVKSTDRKQKSEVTSNNKKPLIDREKLLEILNSGMTKDGVVLSKEEKKELIKKVLLSKI